MITPFQYLFQLVRYLWPVLTLGACFQAQPEEQPIQQQVIEPPVSINKVEPQYDQPLLEEERQALNAIQPDPIPASITRGILAMAIAAMI